MNKLIFIFLIAVTSTIFAQSTDEISKTALYEKEKSRIEQLEEDAKYKGDDEIVRRRLNLPPKLPPIELWNPENQKETVIDGKSDTKENDKIKLETAGEVIVENASANNASVPVIPPIDLNAIDNSDPKNLPKYPKNYIERAISIISFLVLIISNYIIYYKFPSMRKFTIAMPFDLGIKRDSSDTTQRWKRFLIEFILFLPVIFMGLVSFSEVKSNDYVNYIGDFISIISTAFTYLVFYLVIRFIAGFGTKCPKCKTPFAVSTIDSYEEPKSTYKGRVKGFSRMQSWTWHATFLYEVGIKHQDFLCTSCGYEWNKISKYEKVIGHETKY